MNRLIQGAIAGAAGTMALDITSYLDIVVRGRSASNLPAELIRCFAEIAKIPDLSTPDDRADDKTKNRRSALGAISGYSVGIGIGAVYGVVSPLLSGTPLFCRAILVGAAAMAAADVPIVQLKLTDPRQWGTVGWLSDIIPHFAYGLVTAAVVDEFVQDA
jgi:hypothetical protein